MEGGDGGGLGRRRRLTLAPALESGASGSRFSALSPCVGEDAGAEGIASVLDEVEGEESRGVDDGGAWAVGNRHRSEEERLHDFWEYAGFPTPESRPWETPAASSSTSSAGMGFSPMCRSAEEGSRSAPAVPSPVEPVSVAAVLRRRSASPPAGFGKLIVGPKLRMGWRGPLPRPRVTPPPCLGDFLPASLSEALGDPAGAEVDAGAGRGGGTAGSSAGTADSLTSTDVDGGTGRTCVLGRRLWDYHRYRFRGLWRLSSSPNRIRCATAVSLSPPSPPVQVRPSPAWTASRSV